MNTLFPLDPAFPSGFTYHPDFINPQEEQELLQQIAGIALNSFQFQGYEARRKTASFGYDWSFEKRVLTKGKAIPPAFRWLVERVATTSIVPVDNIAELLITEYPSGSVINWHRDAPPFHSIMGVSLLSDCVFKLRPYDKAKQGRRTIISVPVKRRSLYIMRDEARRDWEHSISPVTQTRYSITLRTLTHPGQQP